MNAADVLVQTEERRWGSPIPGQLEIEQERIEDLLAYGDGDPVVIMPDGTIRRAQPSDGWEVVTAHDGLPSLRVRDDLYRFTDPVQPGEETTNG